jgi:uncharacterized protein YjcR
MAEVVTLVRINTDEVKELIADKYGVSPNDIKFWNGKYEFEKKMEEKAESQK